MSYRTPTKKQYECLHLLGNGAMLVSGIGGQDRRTWEALLRYGWVSADQDDPPNGIRLTRDGYYALVRGVERYGLSEMKWNRP